jgi:hypothetical protein
LIAFSEQRGASTAGPEPELLMATWDEEAFSEYFAEHRDDFEEPEE